jgi:hypothetical protein
MFRVKHFGKIDVCASAPAQAGAIRGRDLAQAEEWVILYVFGLFLLGANSFERLFAMSSP